MSGIIGILQPNSVHGHFRLLKKAVKLTLEQLQADSANSLMIDCVREDILLVDHATIVVRRVYVLTPGSSRFSEVGWVMDEDMTSCLCCQKPFSTVTRKHHCRACGSLICKDCSTHAMIIGFSELKTQIVCKTCNPHASVGICLRNMTEWGDLIFDPAVHPSDISIDPAAPGAAHFALYTPLSVEVEPLPGFVIKARRTSPTARKDEKVFINVFHHKSVVDTQELLCYVPGVSPPKPLKGLPRKTRKEKKESPRSVTFAVSTNNKPSTTVTSAPTPHISTGTPRTPYTPDTRGSSLSDKRVAHMHSDYEKYVRSKTGDSPESAKTNMMNNSNHSSSNSISTVGYATSTPSNTNNATTNTMSIPSAINTTSATTHVSFLRTPTPTTPATPSNASTRVYERVTPLLYIGDTSTTTDREGAEVMVYNVLVSSAYFTPEALRGVVTIFNPATVNKIIQVINHHYKADLRERLFSLPKIRLGYKGFSSKSAQNSPTVLNYADSGAEAKNGTVGGDTNTVTTVSTKATTNATTTTTTNTNTDSTALPCMEFYRTQCSVECVPESECSAEDSGRYSDLSEASDSNHSSSTALDVLNSALNNSGSGRSTPDFTRSSSYVNDGSSTNTTANTLANSMTTTTTTTISSVTSPTNGNTALRSLGVRKISNSKDWYTTSRKLSTALRSSNTSTSASVYRNNSIVLTPQMMDIRPLSCVSVSVSDDLKEQSVANPKVLLGYQVIFPYTATSEHGHGPVADQSQVYIITDMRRDAHFHTEYRLTQYAAHEKHRWARLKRSEHKTGTDFRITCRVFAL